MRHIKYFFSMIIFLLVIGCQKEMIDVEDSVPYTITSSHTNEDYSIQVLYPENYDSSLAYQTIYLLDGDWYFFELAEIIKEQHPNDIVLVGIGYKNNNKRNADFTYPADDELPNSGNAKAFIQFLTDELMLFVEDSLNVQSSQRTLAGHSLGGYLGLYLIFQSELNNPFDNIISASPSMIWHEAYLLKLEEEYYATHESLNINLYMTMGDAEGVAMNTLFNAFNKRIESRNYQGLMFDYERFENTTHNNNPIISFQKGISTLIN